MSVALILLWSLGCFASLGLWVHRRTKLDLLSTLLICFPLVLVGFLWVSFGFVWLLGYAWGLTMLVLFCTAIAAGVWRIPARYKLPHFHSTSWSKTSLGSWAITSVVAGTLAFRHVLSGPLRDSSISSSWGDLPLHLSIASFFARQEVPHLELPIFAGEPLRYPFLFDWLSSLLLRGGFSYRASMLLPWLVCMIVLLGLLTMIAQRQGSRWSGVWAPLLLIGGGAASAAYWITQLSGWKETLATQDVTWIGSEGIAWMGTLTGYLIPQRHFPLGLACLCLVGMLAISKRKEAPLWAAVITALLPLVHVHAFLAAGLLCLVAALTTWREHLLKRPIWQLVFLAVLVVAALLQIKYQSGGESRGFFATLPHGWIRDEIELTVPAWKRLTLNLSGLILLVVLCWRKSWQPIALTASLLLVIGWFFRTQPYSWDNSKHFLTVLVLVAPYAAARISSSHWSLRVAVLVLCIVPGFASWYTDMHAQQNPLIYDSEQRLVEQVRGKIPATSRILTAGDHNHPAAVFGGYVMHAGYTGWLYSYGLPYGERYYTLCGAVKGEVAPLQQIADNGVQYLWWGGREKHACGNVLNTAYWRPVAGSDVVYQRR
jgi:hypothetical protein